MIRALIFDMDGVIIDSEPGNLEQVLAYVRSKRPDAAEKELHQIVGRTSQDVWTRIASVIGWDKDWIETRREYKEDWQPVHGSMPDYEKIFRPQSRAILQWAKAKGWKTAVASSTATEKVNMIMNRLGLAPWLDVIVGGDQFRESKPNPEIYLKTAKLLQVSPAECITIEDSTVGITAASRAGVQVVALIDDRYGFDRSLADGQIASLEEFIPFYEKMEAQA